MEEKIKEELGTHLLFVGDRVTRPLVYSTEKWTQAGDAALPDSPLRHGTVVCVEQMGEDRLHVVAWDDGGEGRYIRHGLELESDEETDNRSRLTEDEREQRLRVIREFFGITDEQFVRMVESGEELHPHRLKDEAAEWLVLLGRGDLL